MYLLGLLPTLEGSAKGVTQELPSSRETGFVPGALYSGSPSGKPTAFAASAAPLKAANSKNSKATTSKDHRSHLSSREAAVDAAKEGGKSAAQSSSRSPLDLHLTPEAELRAVAMEEFAKALLAEDGAETEKALSGYRRALDADPSYTELALKVAYELLQRNDAPSGIQVLKDAIKAAPRNPTPVVFLAQIYDKHLHKPELAVKYADQALCLDPEHLPTILAAFEVYCENGQSKKAELLLERGTRSKSKDPQFWLQLGELHSRIWLKDEAGTLPAHRQKINDVYRKAVEYGRKDPEVLSKAADYFVLSKQLQEAAPLYETALVSKSAEKDPSTLSLREKLARTLLATGERQRAVGLLETIVQDSPLRMETHELLGEIHEQNGHPEKSLRCYQQLLLIDPSQPRNYFRVAEAFLRAKQPDKAVATMQDARTQFPEKTEILVSLGLTLSQAKRHDRALETFAEAFLEAQTRHEELLTPQFFFQYGAAAEQAGQLDKAAELLQRSISLDPANAAQARNYLGYMWADRGLHLPDALELLEKAVEAESDNGAFLDSLGWCLFKMGETERALRELLRAEEKIKPEDPVVKEHLGDTYQALGKTREALQAWQKALALDSQNPALAEKIRQASSSAAPTSKAPSGL
jgi:tetratricopeptide (TPR) repeat protein